MNFGLAFPKTRYFYFKLRHVSRYYRPLSKHKAKEFKKEELDIKAFLEVATTILHGDVYNVDKQEEASKL